MKRFIELYRALDATSSTHRKLALLQSYLENTPAADAAWAIYFLSGRRLKRFIGSSKLKAWLLDITNLPAWLVEESYQHVGDLAETLALLAAAGHDSSNEPLHVWMENYLLPLRDQDEEQQRKVVIRWWQQMNAESCFIINKLLTGNLRIGVSRSLVTRALAELTGLPRSVMAQRLLGDWQPSADFYANLFADQNDYQDSGQAYPFYLASPLDRAPHELGQPADWLIEWKWDGIRAQLVKRLGAVHLWSRGEEILSERFPEIVTAAAELPDGMVLDGEILAWGDHVLPFSHLQHRIGRKHVTTRIMQEVPVRFLAYDLLEEDYRDQRTCALSDRRQRLETLLEQRGDTLQVSPLIDCRDWSRLAKLRDESRDRGVEGLMLKARDSVYRTGRVKGDWWKWKIEPLTIDAVLLYAQPGHGRRANLYTDYTFAVWNGDNLVPIAKAYSGLDNNEIEQLDRWIRRHTREKFGPVRSVEPAHVFELAFEGINASHRHKSGVALRFPRIQRWRHDLDTGDADHLQQVQALIPPS